MKAQLFSPKGEKKSQVEMPKVFSTKVRQDIIQKYYEAEKMIQPYAPDDRAGQEHSAAGRIRHQRHKWGSHYGKGISRIPRKTMWRRGTQFYWIGAAMPGTRGGRRAHPPKGIGKEKKINQKEANFALNSALSATANEKYVLQRYSSLEKSPSVPFVIESLPKKTSELISTLKKIFAPAENVIFKKKSVRAGHGKTRGRKYKSTAGVIIITGKDEKANIKGFDIIKTDDLKIADLYPIGRLALYTEKALSDLSKEALKQ